MPITTVQFRPGINRETTDFGNEGGWFDCNLVRFRQGFPEKMGGWIPLTDETYTGVARALTSFTSLSGSIYTALATNKKLYIESAGSYNDITPIRLDVTLGTDPIETGSAGSGIITITHNTHGATVGSCVTLSGATAVDGITAGQINTEHAITEVVDANSYTVTTTGSATSGSTSGGGSSVDAEYDINTGTEDNTFDTGWGTGSWSRGAWGSSSTAVQVSDLRTWSLDNWGEDLIATIRNGAIYYWDSSGGLSSPAIELKDVAGSTFAPEIATTSLVLTENRQLVVFGANPIDDTANQDKLLIRWSDNEDLTTWFPEDNNTAGSLRVSAGAFIVTARRTRGETLIWTDSSLHSLQFVGGQLVFGLTDISTQTNIIGPNAVATVGDAAYWMGNRGFFLYDGRVKSLPCTVEDYVFSDINTDQLEKIFCGVNTNYEEVYWFYPSATSTENDRYVVFNYLDNLWYYGAMPRSAWENSGLRTYPLGADPGTNKLFLHDNGLNDGSTDPVTAMDAYITSSNFDIGDGDRFMFVREFIPDITFRDSATGSPSVTYTFDTRTEPGGGVLETENSSTTQTSETPVEQYTKKGYIRKRGRSMSVKIASDTTGVDWRAGNLRLNIRPDGRR